MPQIPHFRTIYLNLPVGGRFLCTKPARKPRVKISHAKEFQKYFRQHPSLGNVVPRIPKKYFGVYLKHGYDNVYLISPEVAKETVDIIYPLLSDDQVIGETSPGLGLITKELLDRGLEKIRLYEVCGDFRQELKHFDSMYPGRVELINKDLFQLSRYEYMDRVDKYNRVETLLRGVPKRNWTDDPVMTVIGPMPHLKFLKFLMFSLAFKSAPTTYGRIQIFCFMRPRDYAVLTAKPENNLLVYQKWSILFNLVFDIEILEKFPRKMFLPWDSIDENQHRGFRNLEHDMMYLIRINLKEDLPVPSEEFIQLFYYIRQFYGRGNTRIVPTIEKWVPECGKNLIIPTLHHKDYYNEMGIFTRFRELTPTQIVSVYKEMTSFPNYENSPFMDMINAELIKSITVETILADDISQKNIIEEIEENLYVS